jgi:hypothetical protein
VYKYSEGYPDPTAGAAFRHIAEEKRAKDLISVLRYIIRVAGFELINRIEIREKKSGREFR